MEERASSRAGGGQRREPQLHKYFRAMTAQGASDLHIKAGAVPHLRMQTRIVPVKSEPLTGERIEQLVDEILNDRQRATLEQYGGIDLAAQIPGGDRFRINVFRQRGQLSVAVRRVSREIPTFEQLHLPGSLRKIAEHDAGLVLVAGMTGSGKSTTIAAVLESINQTRPCHIVTIEDPIEYLYADKKALVSQREVGIDVPTFEHALKYVLREDPDVILIGEMRDRDTFQAALQAAETGHLVFGTIHASTAASTVGRVLDLFPTDSRDLARQSLAFNLRAVICQKLLPCLADGIDRVPAVEVLLINPAARQMLAEQRDSELLDVIRSSEHEGMQDFTRSLLELIEKDYVEPKVAYAAASNPDELRMRVKGISSSQTGMRR